MQPVMSYLDLSILVFFAFVILYAADAVLEFFSNKQSDDVEQHYGEFTEADVNRLHNLNSA